MSRDVTFNVTASQLRALSADTALRVEAAATVDPRIAQLRAERQQLVNDLLYLTRNPERAQLKAHIARIDDKLDAIRWATGSAA